MKGFVSEIREVGGEKVTVYSWESGEVCENLTSVERENRTVYLWNGREMNEGVKVSRQIINGEEKIVHVMADKGAGAKFIYADEEVVQEVKRQTVKPNPIKDEITAAVVESLREFFPTVYRTKEGKFCGEYKEKWFSVAVTGNKGEPKDKVIYTEE